MPTIEQLLTLIADARQLILAAYAPDSKGYRDWNVDIWQKRADEISEQLATYNPKAAEIHDALVACYNATSNEQLREFIALLEVMILETRKDGRL